LKPLPKTVPSFLEEYYSNILLEIERVYSIASEFRKRTNSPIPYVETILADDIAERVEILVGPKGISEKIRELQATYRGEQLALKLAEEIVDNLRGSMDDEKVIKQALSTALAILTPPCITAAPTEGISHVKIKTNNDGSRYLAVYFAGPIRSAGGTELAAVVVLADYIRRLMGLDRYKPTEEEVRRFIEELRTYTRRVGKFQYSVPDNLIAMAIKKTPVEITGIPTDKITVPAYTNLPRIETNYLRGGALRVVNDGIVGRAKKVLKLVQSLGIDGWEWVEELIKQARDIKKGDTDPDDKLSEVIGGRPVFSIHNTFGGFRIRYARPPNVGMSAVGVHPITMRILNGYIIVGTQLKTDYPGKGGVVTPVEVEPPVVKTNDGRVVKVDSEEKYQQVKDKISKILFLGDIVISVGDCIENNVELRPPGYCEEWWAEELKEALVKQKEKPNIHHSRLLSFMENPLCHIPSFEEALAISKTLDIPLHPRYTFFWENITVDELITLREWLKELPDVREKLQKLVLPANDRISDILTALLVEHEYANYQLTINSENLKILTTLLKPDIEYQLKDSKSDVFEILRELSGVKMRRKYVSSITARMGRPEKADIRSMDPSVMVLFPISLSGGNSRDVITAVKKGSNPIVDLVLRRCPSCGEKTWKEKCGRCGGFTVIVGVCGKCASEFEYNGEDVCRICGGELVFSSKQVVDLKKELEDALKTARVDSPDKVSAVKGLNSLVKQPEMLVKGILRRSYGLYVYKDGTIRFDSTNAPLTHFRPRQVNIDVATLRRLGYTHDIYGNPLVSEEQVCELKIQDIILPKKAGEHLVKVSKYVDDLLHKAAGMERYYRWESIDDVIGNLVVVLSPHTYAGVVCRVIGFVDAETTYAHPVLHAAKRRDCDGDEDSIMLLLDVLMNFSRLYLPNRIGGKMDSPLLITRIVYPEEVDEQAHNVDICFTYPLEFYRAAENGAKVSDITHLLETIKDRLSDDHRFYGIGFTLPRWELSIPRIESAYKKLDTMLEKISSQLELTEKLQAVKTSAVAEKIIATHLLPDILGNIRAFFIQSFRCKKCGKRYRRLPLSGRCINCQGELIQTVFRGAIEKYIELASDIVEKYGRDEYLIARTRNAIENIVEVFRESKKNETRKQEGIQATLESFNN